MMKAKIIIPLLLFLLLLSLAFIFIMYDNNSELSIQLESRDTLIKKIQVNDSLSCAHTADYTKTITKYVTSDCELLIGNKKVSLNEFINIYIDESKKNALQEIQILKLRDSINILQQRIDFIKNRFGITITSKDDGQSRIDTYHSDKLDTALRLYDTFRGKLKYDSATKKWKLAIPK